MFVGRRAELQFLENHYQASGNRIVVLYGRKGVGKTELLKEFSKNKYCAYYAARSCSEQEQRYQWSRELAAQGHYMEVFPEYQTLFTSCVANSGEQKSVIILDEFHNFVKADPEFMPQLIHFTEQRQESRPVLIVLCSSATGWIENSMISKMGRSALSLAALLKVRELKFREMRQLYPQYSADDALMIYAALGGNPGLWGSFSPQLSARENLIRNLVHTGSRLHEEMSVYVAEELRETAVYNTLLATMASGVSKLNDLFVHTGFSRAKISVYLKNLMELDLVEKISSFESRGYENTQKGIYRISNSYVQFYYCFLYPNQSALQMCTPEDFFEKYVEPGFQAFLEAAYRRICREMIAEEYPVIGEWIGKNGTIEIVAKQKDGEVMAGICRYTRQVTSGDCRHLAEYLKQARLTPAKICLFSEREILSEISELEKQGHLEIFTVL